VDDVLRRQVEASRDPRLAGRARRNPLARAGQLRSGRGVDGTTDTAPGPQAFVGGVHDRVDVERGDVREHRRQGSGVVIRPVARHPATLHEPKRGTRAVTVPHDEASGRGRCQLRMKPSEIDVVGRLLGLNRPIAKQIVRSTDRSQDLQI
jgi:hypothetical protein